MIHKLQQLVQKQYYPLLLIGIAWWIAVSTYEPGTWLSGWDSLHPEFNFHLAFKRVIDGVWREEQGFGVVAGHSHMAEIARYILLYPLSFIVPSSFLRYIYMYACFIAGPVGVYSVLVYWFRQNTAVLGSRKNISFGQRTRRIVSSIKNLLAVQLPFSKRTAVPTRDENVQHAAFLGAIFYIFNISVLHHFLVPFEMFPTQYAFLPWLFLYVTKYLVTFRRRYLAIFSVLTFFASPMAYAAHLWHVYFISLMMYSAVVLLGHRVGLWTWCKHLFIVGGVTVGINAFWLFPHIYHIVHNAHWVPASQINWLFSEHMFLYNQARGGIGDIAVLQGALFDFLHFNGQWFTPVFESSLAHITNPYVMAIGYGAFALVIVGIVRAIYKKELYGIALLPAFLFTFVFLTTASPLWSWFFKILFEKSSIFKEAMRSPYTKFSIVLLFTYSTFFGYAMQWVLGRVQNAHNKLFVSVVSLLLMIYMLPLLQGNLINKHMKVAIPDDYFQLFDYFNLQDKDAHVAMLPAHVFWGWEYYDWGYQGAGFIWYGIPQTTIVRDADWWSPQNENFYWELSHAIYSGDRAAVSRVLEKYSVSWVVIDRSKISPDNPKATYFEKISAIAENSPSLRKVRSFGALDVYRVSLEHEKTDFRFVADGTWVGPTYTYSESDSAFKDYGIYFSETAGEHGTDSSYPWVYYPFRTLFTGKAKERMEFVVEEREDEYVLSSIIPQELPPPGDVVYEVELPTTTHELVSLSDERVFTEHIYQPSVYANGERIREGERRSFQGIPAVTVHIPKLKGHFSYDSADDASFDASSIRCGTSRDGTAEVVASPSGVLTFSTVNASLCHDIDIPNLPHKYSYLVRLDHEYVSGLPLQMILANRNSERQDMVVQLSADQTASFIIVPAMEQHGQGYGLELTNESIGAQKTVNHLERVRIQQFPYEFIESIRLVQQNAVQKKPLLVYAQNYDIGWAAYSLACQGSGIGCQVQRALPFLFGTKLETHVEVNNWANGWVLSEEQKAEHAKDVVIVFLPQYLEYAGFMLLGGVGAGLFLVQKQTYSS